MKFPVGATDCDGAARAPFADYLIGVGRGEFGFGVAVLGEDKGQGEGLEVGDKAEDVGEGGGCHGGEDGLHVDNEESSGHFGGCWSEGTK